MYIYTLPAIRAVGNTSLLSNILCKMQKRKERTVPKAKGCPHFGPMPNIVKGGNSISNINININMQQQQQQQQQSKNLQTSRSPHKVPSWCAQRTRHTQRTWAVEPIQCSRLNCFLNRFYSHFVSWARQIKQFFDQ